MKRLVQYLILAAVLVGLPLGCAWIAGMDEILSGVAAFPPRTEDWGAAEYWQQRCPFNWTVFVVLAAVVVTVVGTFARKAWKSRTAIEQSEQSNNRTILPWWGWLGLVMFLGWLPIVWLRPEWAAKLQVHSFAIMGFGHAFLMDALACRRGAVSVFKANGKGFLCLLPVSAAFWWFFEFLNRFSRNWYFINMEDYTTFEYVFCFSLGCATILPSVLTTARWLGTFRCFSDRVCGGMWKVDVDSCLSRLVMAAVSLVGLVGIVFIPSVAFPFLWLSPICVFVLVRGAFGERTELVALSTGNWSRL